MRTYEYYIWDDNLENDDDQMADRIQTALSNAGLNCEYKNFEDD